jgi:RNA polymerase sigma-70 factor (ECF subfamily)
MGRLYLFLRARVDCDHDAEDLLQATLLNAWRAWERFQEDNLLAWLFSIARNLLRNHRTRRRPTVPLALVPEDSIAVGALVMSVEEEEEMASLRRCLERLTEEQRTVIVLRHSEGLDIESIAARLGLDAARVYRIRQSAVERLRRCVNEGTGP